MATIKQALLDILESVDADMSDVYNDGLPPGNPRETFEIVENVE